MCIHALLCPFSYSRIMIEEAASNALKYGVAGSALCRVSYGPNPLGSARTSPMGSSLFAGTFSI